MRRYPKKRNRTTAIPKGKQKLSDLDVKEIRHLVLNLSIPQTEAVRIFGSRGIHITQPMVSYIVNGKQRQDVM